MTHSGHIEGRADTIFRHRNVTLNYDRLHVYAVSIASDLDLNFRVNKRSHRK
jgi:hypothetical protein